jgi:protein tyrosine phosphatase (PTP) superfamily phosphohydrolase (DUF442 family)
MNNNGLLWRGSWIAALHTTVWASTIMPGVPVLPPPPAPTTPAQTPPPTTATDAPIDAPGLLNVVAYGPSVWSGSVPVGDAGFATLKAWGVQTVISVDGATPDLTRANAAGIRYVHLPIGYDGFDDARKLQLVRAVRDLPKPIYIHCHHGKHRSAGAAGTIAVSLGWLTTEAALARMKISGTAPNYAGLYACTASAALLNATTIDQASPEFPSVTRPNGLVEAMLAIDDTNDRLTAIERAGWKVPADHSDLVPVAEAAALADHLRLLAASPEIAARPTSFRDLLAKSQSIAQRLEDQLSTVPSGDPARLSADMQALQATCKECHASARNQRSVPRDVSATSGAVTPPPAAP